MTISPTWGDPNGGTLVTIVGENFLHTQQLYCRFGISESIAKWVNSSAISCVAPRKSDDGSSVVIVQGNTFSAFLFFFLSKHLSLSDFVVSENGFDWTTNNETFVYGGRFFLFVG